MFDVSFPIAFWAGLASFFAPCVIPLFPAYLAYISSDTLEHFGNKKEVVKSRVIFSSLMYILGFSLMFVVLGSSLASVGVLFRRYSDVVRIFGGFLILVFGLELFKIINVPYLNMGGVKTVPKWTEKMGIFRPFLIGIVFASTWAPCVGPILGSILTLAVVQDTSLRGALLLFTYSLGISLPFLTASIMISYSRKFLDVLKSRLELVSKISGLLMVVLGVLLITNKFGYINSFFGNLF